MIETYVAMGDSLSEGLMDLNPDHNSFRGWTDRLAEHLTGSPTGSPDLRFANIAIRGRLLQQIVDKQLDAALALKPDLVSICAGGNDCLRPHTDIEKLATTLEHAVIRLREAGCQVLLGNGFDTSGLSPLLKAVRPRVAIYNCHLWTIAQRHGCLMLDLWGMRDLYGADMWASDRIHLSAAGHELVANHALATLEGKPLPNSGFLTPIRGPRPILQTVAAEVSWVRSHLAPWVGRRIRGVSSGDGLSPKAPSLERVRPDDPADTSSDSARP